MIRDNSHPSSLDNNIDSKDILAKLFSELDTVDEIIDALKESAIVIEILSKHLDGESISDNEWEDINSKLKGLMQTARKFSNRSESIINSILLINNNGNL